MKNLFYLLSIVLVSIWSCSPYPDETDYVSDYDIVVTDYDPNANFSKYDTYILPSKIPNLNDSETESYLDDTNPALANLIKSELRSKMNSRGYTQVSTAAENPDLVLNVGVFSDAYTSGYAGSCWWYDDPYYWGWYGDWYYPDLSWGYYPCYGSAWYTFQTGSLTLDLVDVEATKAQDCDSPNNDCSLAIIWHGMIRGLLTENEQNMETRIKNSINQAFSQSAYIKN